MITNVTMVNLTILFDTTMKTQLPTGLRSYLNEQVHHFNFHIENFEGRGYAEALKKIHARIHKVFTKMNPCFSQTGVRIHIALEPDHSPYTSSSYRGAKSKDFQLISQSAWDQCIGTAEDPTVVACVELAFHSHLVHRGLFSSWHL